MSTDDDTWKYLPVLNAGIQIILSIGIGFGFAHFGVFTTREFVPQAIKFVFYVALPCLVLNGLGINIDLYDDAFLWSYITAFLILRAISLIFALLMTYFNKGGIGDVAVAWLSMTWISTVILGVPILTSVFGSAAKGQFYGLLAGISSFIFQLPFQLFFLEVHKIEREYLNRKQTITQSEPDEEKNGKGVEEISPSDSKGKHVQLPVVEAPGITPAASSDPNENNEHEIIHIAIEPETDAKKYEENKNHMSALEIWQEVQFHHDILSRIFFRIFKNPVFLAICLAFLVTLSTLGPEYLKKTSEDFEEGLQFITDTLAWFGAIVSPLNLFAMGIWIQGEFQAGRLLKGVSYIRLAWDMIVKLILVPLLMVGLAKMMELRDEAGRAAILIAVLPISMASFSLGHEFKIGEDILSANVFVGTALMLPATIAWNVIMDDIELYPID